MTFPFYPHTSVDLMHRPNYPRTGQVDTNLVDAAQRRVNELYAQWTALGSDIVKRQKDGQSETSLAPLRAEFARVENVLRQAQRQLQLELNAGPPRVLSPDELRIRESIFSVARLPEQLRAMQTKLQAAGYAIPPSEIGVFGNVGPSPDSKTGPETFRAIQKFQIDQRLPANGVFNRQTSDALDRVLNVAPAPPSPPPSPTVIAEALASLRANLAVLQQQALQFRGTPTAFALEAQVQQMQQQILGLESVQRTVTTATPGEGGVTEPNAAPARPNYLVPAIVVGVALLAGGYLLSRPRA